MSVVTSFLVKSHAKRLKPAKNLGLITSIGHRHRTTSAKKSSHVRQKLLPNGLSFARRVKFFFISHPRLKIQKHSVNFTKVRIFSRIRGPRFYKASPKKFTLLRPFLTVPSLLLSSLYIKKVSYSLYSLALLYYAIPFGME